MRSEGTMKVVIFETDSTKDSTAIAVGKLFNEAANWLHWESITEVPISPKKKGKRDFKNLSLALSEVCEDDPDGSPKQTMQLFIHFDDNEYQK